MISNKYVHYIEAQNINELSVLALKEILENGHEIESRDSNKTKEILNTSLILENPKNRHLALKERKSNIFSTIAEIIWIMAGKNDFLPFLKEFIPLNILTKFSDNYNETNQTGTWRGGYGPRLYSHNQLENVLFTFIKDNIHTRRAVLSLWQPEFDTYSSLKEKNNLENSVDIPCTLFLNFWIRNKKLNLKAIMRSNDAYVGFMHINVFEFTFLQELILDLLNNYLEEKIELGYYHHEPTSFHIYKKNYEKVDNIVNSDQELSTKKTKNLYFPISSHVEDSIQLIESFFLEIYNLFTNDILSNVNANNLSDHLNKITKIFTDFDTKTDDNQLFDYIYSLLLYQYKKKDPSFSIQNYIQDFSDDFKFAIRHFYLDKFNENI